MAQDGTHLLTVALSVALVGVGCDALEETRERGRYGELYFRADTGGPLRDIDHPVAVGAKLDIEVEDDNGDPVMVQEALFRSDRAFEVVGVSGNRITVRAIDDSDELLEVVAMGDEELEDSVRLTAEVTEVVRFSHQCGVGKNDTAHFLTGTAPRLGISLRERLGDELMGYGYAPVNLEPEGVLQFDENRVDSAIYFDTPEAPGSVTVRSIIGDAEARFRIVDVEDVGDIEVTGLRRVSLDGLTPTRKVWPLVGENRVCRAASLVEVIRYDPTHCDAEMIAESGDEHAKLKISAKSPGPCDITLGVSSTGLRKNVRFDITE